MLSNAIVNVSHSALTRSFLQVFKPLSRSCLILALLLSPDLSCFVCASSSQGTVIGL